MKGLWLRSSIICGTEQKNFSKPSFDWPFSAWYVNSGKGPSLNRHICRSWFQLPISFHYWQPLRNAQSTLLSFPQNIETEEDILTISIRTLYLRNRIGWGTRTPHLITSKLYSSLYSVNYSTLFCSIFHVHWFKFSHTLSYFVLQIWNLNLLILFSIIIHPFVCIYNMLYISIIYLR